MARDYGFASWPRLKSEVERREILTDRGGGVADTRFRDTLMRFDIRFVEPHLKYSVRALR